jgi:hypothetical protein
MGWKNVKVYYCIQGQVLKHPLCLSIGAHKEVMISLETCGIHSRPDYCSPDLMRIVEEMRADRDQLRALIEAPDTFDDLITIWTYKDAEIIEKQCEAVGWPNPCTDGTLQYEDKHHTDRAMVEKWAMENAIARVNIAEVYLTDATHQLKLKEKEWVKAREVLEQLQRGVLGQ